MPAGKIADKSKLVGNTQVKLEIVPFRFEQDTLCMVTSISASVKFICPISTRDMLIILLILVKLVTKGVRLAEY